MSGNVIQSASYQQHNQQDEPVLTNLRRFSDRHGLRGLIALSALFTVSIGGYGFAYLLLVWLA